MPYIGPNLNGQTTASASTSIVVASDQSPAMPVTAPSYTLGTQGSTGASVQRISDAGRTMVTYYATHAATTASEVMMSLTQVRGTTNNGAGTSWTLTNAKRFRIQGIWICSRNGTGISPGQGATTFSIRVNSGTVINSSTLMWQGRIVHKDSTTEGRWDNRHFPIYDGWDILGDGSIQIGASVKNATGTAPLVDLQIIGYEY